MNNPNFCGLLVNAAYDIVFGYFAKKKKGQSSISESIQHLGHPGDRKKPQEVRKIVPPGS